MDPIIAPARKAFAIVPNDGADLADVTRAIYVGAAGDVKAQLVDDAAAVTFVGAAAGSVLPIRAKRVWATGTTAASLVALV